MKLSASSQNKKQSTIILKQSTIILKQSDKNKSKKKNTYPTSVTDWATDEALCSKNSHAAITTGSAKMTCKKQSLVTPNKKLPTP